MSITLNTVLALPSLRRATVLAGREGLGNIITSISVLEYSTPNAIQKDFLSQIEFTGGEIKSLRSWLKDRNAWLPDYYCPAE